jgi:predicted DNA-binding transcriptional regulator AlpA
MTENPPFEDALLTAEQAAKMLGLTRAALYQQVAAGRLPAPCYVAPRAPRWWKARLIEAVNATEMRPRDAKAARRKAKLDRLFTTTA